MLFGDDVVLKTPLTGAFVRVRTLLSGNSGDAMLWSDGRIQCLIDPALIELFQPALIRKAPNTGELFWTADCEVVDDMGYERRVLPMLLLDFENATPEQISEADDKMSKARKENLAAFKEYEKEVPLAEEPTSEELRDILGSRLVADADQERYVRQRLWWAENDPRRFDQRLLPMSPAARDNVFKLLALTDDTDPGARLTFVEAYREMGDFARATEQLAFEFPPKFARAIRFQQDLIEKQDPGVHLFR